MPAPAVPSARSPRITTMRRSARSASPKTRALDARKVNDWLSYLLQNHGEDILRMKGVLNLAGDDRRYIFHGVHMMFDGRPERAWGKAPRSSQLVFIGRKLDREELLAGFSACIA